MSKLFWPKVDKKGQKKARKIPSPHLFFSAGSSVIVWKQTDRIISAGDVLLRKDSRMSLIKGSNGFNLQLANVTPDDRGKY